MDGSNKQRLKFQGVLLYWQMELRYNEVERARMIYERYVQCIPTVKAWVRFAKFEMQNGEVGLARKSYERAVEELAEDGETVSIRLCKSEVCQQKDSAFFCKLR